MTVYVFPIVEGHTEQGCVAKLLHRVWSGLLARPERLQIAPAYRGHRDQLFHPSGTALQDAVRAASATLKPMRKRDPSARTLILILLDADDDCPAEHAPRLLELAQSAVAPDVPLSCVFARRTLENWIVAGASTLGGVAELPGDLPPRDRHEEIRGVNWLNAQLKRSRQKYRKTTNAIEFVEGMNLEECRTNCPSFDKLCRDLEAIAGPADAPEA